MDMLDIDSFFSKQKDVRGGFDLIEKIWLIDNQIEVDSASPTPFDNRVLVLLGDEQ